MDRPKYFKFGLFETVILLLISLITFGFITSIEVMSNNIDKSINLKFGIVTIVLSILSLVSFVLLKALPKYKLDNNENLILPISNLYIKLFNTIIIICMFYLINEKSFLFFMSNLVTDYNVLFHFSCLALVLLFILPCLDLASEISLLIKEQSKAVKSALDCSNNTFNVDKKVKVSLIVTLVFSSILLVLSSLRTLFSLFFYRIGLNDSFVFTFNCLNLIHLIDLIFVYVIVKLSKLFIKQKDNISNIKKYAIISNFILAFGFLVLYLFYIYSFFIAGNLDKGINVNTLYQYGFSFTSLIFYLCLISFLLIKHRYRIESNKISLTLLNVVLVLNLVLSFAQSNVLNNYSIYLIPMTNLTFTSYIVILLAYFIYKENKKNENNKVFNLLSLINVSINLLTYLVFLTTSLSLFIIYTDLYSMYLMSYLNTVFDLVIMICLIVYISKKIRCVKAS